MFRAITTKGRESAREFIYRFSASGAVPRTLRARLGDTISVKDFGAKGDGVTDDTASIQAAIDAVYARGGGVIDIPDGVYLFGASALAETYDNFGVPVAASDCGLVLRKGVSLSARGRDRCRLVTTNKGIMCIAMVAPDGNAIESLTVESNWNAGDAGSGHGIFVLGTAGGADVTCKNVRLKNLRIKNVASYGIGLQNGNPRNVIIEDIEVENTGADGLDLKARSDSATEPSGNRVDNIVVINHGQRVDGSAGVDIRGVWHVAKATVKDFGGNAGLSYLGVRVRTKPPVTDAYNRAGARTAIDQVYVRPTIGAAATSIVGVQSGSDDVKISNVVTDDCTIGVEFTGNVNGNPTRNHLSNASLLNSRQYGVKVGTGCSKVRLSNVDTTGSVTAGFRNEGDNTKMVNCEATEATGLSTSAGASPTEMAINCSFANELGIKTYSAAAGRVNIDAVGASANIDIHISPKGTGQMRFGTHTVNADAPVTGYITIRDTSGTVRKLAVIA